MENEVAHDDVKAFMNSPEEVKAPPPMMVDDFKPAVDENGEPIIDYRLTTEQIASIAYHSVSMLDAALKPDSWLIWDQLPSHMQRHYIGLVDYFMNSVANPNGHEACQGIHDLVIDAKLKGGWRYGESYSEEGKTDPTLLPYKTLPLHLKSRNFLFRCVTAGLVALWKGH